MVRVRLNEPAVPPPPSNTVRRKKTRIVWFPLVPPCFIQEKVRTFDAPELLVESSPIVADGLIPAAESSTNTSTPATDPEGTLLNCDDNSMRRVQVPAHAIAVGVNASTGVVEKITAP